jgi:hypothetical protein
MITQFLSSTIGNNYPANGFRDQIKTPKSIAVNDILENDLINTYVEICKEDISEKRWKRLIEGNKTGGSHISS